MREATVLPDAPAAMDSSNAPCPPRLPCLVVIASDWRNIHPLQPLPRDPFLSFIRPATVRQKRATQLKIPLELALAPPLGVLGLPFL